MLKKKFATLALAALATTTLAACGADDTPNTPGPAVTAGGAPSEVAPTTQSASPTESTTTRSETTPSVESVEPPTGAQLAAGSVEDAAKARELAIAHVAAEVGSNGTVIAQDLEDRDNRWDVDVIVGDRVHEVKVSTVDESTRTDETKNADGDDRAAASAAVTIEQAIDVALANTPGIVEDAKWDDDDTQAWQIDVVPTGQDDDVEIHVDSNSGEVVAVD